MFSMAYQKGFSAKLRDAIIIDCPYGGHNPGSSILRAEWIHGYQAAGSSANFDLPRPSAHVRRRNTRTRWPRSTYARNRLRQILEQNMLCGLRAASR